MVSMIVTDLDGTLLRDDKTVSAYTVKILEKCRDKGIKTVFATARGGSSKLLVPYGIFDGRILTNGASAYLSTGEEIYAKRIPPIIMEPFLQKLDSYGIKAAAEIDGIHYANFKVSDKWEYIRYFVISDFINLPGYADKLYFFSDYTDIKLEFLPPELYISRSRDGLFMVMHKKAAKFHAVKALAKAWGINTKNIAAFGDDLNDLDMIKGCGYGVSMGNAVDEIKIAAKYICKTNEEDGAALWLCENVL